MPLIDAPFFIMGQQGLEKNKNDVTLNITKIIFRLCDSRPMNRCEVISNRCSVTYKKGG
jgi:hypothetical protein